jgi:3-hydroxyisobutyrate dehydrogenase
MRQSATPRTLADRRPTASDLSPPRRLAIVYWLASEGKLTMATVAFIGLGNMGAPMAANLLKAGHSLKVYDIVPQAVARLTALGAAGAESPADAAAEAEFVISMLPAGRHVEDLYLGAGGLLKSAPAGALLVDCSTIDPGTARRVAAAAAARGLDMLDAPVSGGVAGATAGTLTFMVGGPAAALERARPLLGAMGRNIFRAGERGAGQVAKICNNMLLGIAMVGTAEALALGAANGLDPKVLSEIMRQSSGGNWVLNSYNPWPGVMPGAPASRDYAGGFAVNLMLKDLGLATEAAASSGNAVPLGSLARDLYTQHSAAGAGNLDFSSILRLLTAGK